MASSGKPFMILLGALLVASTPFLLLFTTQASGEPGGDFHVTKLRDYSDGAGPSAIFRLGRHENRDVIGLVDPVLWRIQFYTLADQSASQPKPLSERLRSAGDCLLPPTFRVWRLHQFPDRAVLQSQPEVTLSRVNNSSATFNYAKVTIRSDSETLRRLATSPTTAVKRDKPAHDCDRDFTSGSTDPRPRFVPETDASHTISGGENRDFTVARRHLTGNATSFARRRITIAAQGGYLASAQELETTRAEQPDMASRHFIVTSRVESLPGFKTSVVTIYRRNNNSTLNRAMVVNTGLARVKAGQRFAAIASSGEVLLVGAADHDGFKMYSCTFEARRAPSLCKVDSAYRDSSASQATDANTDGEGISEDVLGSNARDVVWNKAWWQFNQTYAVDTTKIPDDCRAWPGPCTPMAGSSIPWVPLAEVRLHTGRYEKKGVPYAQTHQTDGRPAQNTPLGFDTTNAIPAFEKRDGRHYLFGDIKNADSLIGSGTTSVFGTDCSALLAELWGTSITETSSLIVQANKRTYMRVKDVAAMRMNDAFLISLKDTLNHVVIYREQRRAGRYDSSKAFLVFEASSTCGGVCWSFYDESFFHGWAIIRNEKGGDAQASFVRIPGTYPEWKERFVDAGAAP